MKSNVAVLAILATTLSAGPVIALAADTPAADTSASAPAPAPAKAKHHKKKSKKAAASTAAAPK